MTRKVGIRISKSSRQPAGSHLLHLSENVLDLQNNFIEVPVRGQHIAAVATHALDNLTVMQKLRIILEAHERAVLLQPLWRGCRHCSRQPGPQVSSTAPWMPGTGLSPSLFARSSSNRNHLPAQTTTTAQLSRDPQPLLAAAPNP